MKSNSLYTVFIPILPLPVPVNHCNYQQLKNQSFSVSAVDIFSFIKIISWHIPEIEVKKSELVFYRVSKRTRCGHKIKVGSYAHASYNKDIKTQKYLLRERSVYG